MVQEPLWVPTKIAGLNLKGASMNVYRANHPQKVQPLHRPNRMGMVDLGTGAECFTVMEGGSDLGWVMEQVKLSEPKEISILNDICGQRQVCKMRPNGLKLH